MFEFLKLLNKPFYVLSGSSYLKNSGIMTHPLYKGAIAIEKKNELFSYVLDDIDSTSEKILLCYRTNFFLEFLINNFESIVNKFSEIIIFLPDESYNKEIIFTFIDKNALEKLKSILNIF